MEAPDRWPVDESALRLLRRLALYWKIATIAGLVAAGPAIIMAAFGIAAAIYALHT
jgi:hypothetical protein